MTKELEHIKHHSEAQEAEVANLRSRGNLSQQNWIKERDELISKEAYAREEFENAKQAMQDWEVLAMNERSLRENLAEKEAEMREQLDSLREAYEKAANDRDTNGQAVEGLQKALQEVQARKLPPRETHGHDGSNKTLQSAEQSSRNQLKTMNHKSMSFASKFGLLKMRLHRLKPLSPLLI